MLYIEVSPGHYQPAREDEVISEATQIYNYYLPHRTNCFPTVSSCGLISRELN